MAFDQINWLAVIVVTVANMVIGFLWYGPIFGQTWLRLIGKRAEEIEGSSVVYGISALAALVSAVVLALVVTAFGADTIVSGLVAGAVLWIGIGATGTLVYTTFEGPPYSVWLLHASYMLVVFIIGGAVLAVWR